MKQYELITILGPTAGGKTTLAAALAAQTGAEIISADSRQVYRRMNIGSGKDLADYVVDSRQIPYHLIDLCEPGDQYNVYQYQHDFFSIFNKLKNDNQTPILCGGSGLYIEAVLKGYQLLDVPPNIELRKQLQDKSLNELAQILAAYKTPHNTTDFDSSQRAVRAIEIADYNSRQTPQQNQYQPINSLIVGLDVDRDLRRQKITARLRQRLDEGMIDEVRSLLDSGVKPEILIGYGLEYKYITQYILGQLTLGQMIDQLEIAIHQFAKRQMTWFRGMQRRGLEIHWIDASLPLDEKINAIIQLLKK